METDIEIGMESMEMGLFIVIPNDDKMEMGFGHYGTMEIMELDHGVQVI